MVWLFQLPVFYSQENPLRAPSSPTTNYLVDFSNFSTTRPILDPKVSLDRDFQDLKPMFRILRQNPIFNSIQSVSRYYITCQYFTLHIFLELNNKNSKNNRPTFSFFINLHLTTKYSMISTYALESPLIHAALNFVAGRI